MNKTKEQIASRLEQAFSRRGFKESSVARLQKAAGVSLRTLYRYFPSKESMVTGALDHRHGRYLAFLNQGAHDVPGPAAVMHLLRRLGDWMGGNAPGGCLWMNAWAAYPDNPRIRETVGRHKEEMIRLMARLSGREDLAGELFLIHEGASAAWPLQGMEAIRAAESAVLKLMEGGQDE